MKAAATIGVATAWFIMICVLVVLVVALHNDSEAMVYIGVALGVLAAIGGGVEMVQSSSKRRP